MRVKLSTCCPLRALFCFPCCERCGLLVCTPTVVLLCGTCRVVTCRVVMSCCQGACLRQSAQSAHGGTAAHGAAAHAWDNVCHACDNAPRQNQNRYVQCAKASQTRAHKDKQTNDIQNKTRLDTLPWHTSIKQRNAGNAMTANNSRQQTNQDSTSLNKCAHQGNTLVLSCHDTLELCAQPLNTKPLNKQTTQQNDARPEQVNGQPGPTRFRAGLQS